MDKQRIGVVSPEFFLLFSGYRALSPRLKQPGRETDHLPLQALRMCGTIPPLSHMP